MASLTVRKLDEALKAALRMRAARHGRSVEDEIRVILREVAESDPADKTESDGGISRAQAVLPPLGATTSSASRPFTPETKNPSDWPRITLIIGGGIAAYKSLDLIRRLKEQNLAVRCVMTGAAQQFVTPLSVSALAHEPCYTDLFDARSEFDAGHIRLARDCDLVIVAPATADLMAKMANGHADDLASAILLATNQPILLAPAMNPLMWRNAATQRNVASLRRDGVHFIGPNVGEMAEAREAGLGRMAEPLEITATALPFVRPSQTPLLAGRRVLVTAGPTHEPIDPVRYIANRSSGKQGFAIAAAAAAAGADVTLVSGPVDLPDPTGITVKRVESARDMLAAVMNCIERDPSPDVAIFAAAVADWRVANAGMQKIKKTDDGLPSLAFAENPDILATVAQLSVHRPGLVIGFAAETEHLLDNARAKLRRKGCDWLLANDVSPATGVMGGDRNTIHLLMRDATDVESWPVMSKDEVAATLVARIAQFIGAEMTGAKMTGAKTP
jgi:phosphopantothenoylcysteine decarboxylase/phosphopantothenate--cysteine ligase